jgi:hypothetical protein
VHCTAESFTDEAALAVPTRKQPALILSSSQFLVQVSLLHALSPNRASRVIAALGSNRGIGKWRKKLIEIM